MLCSMQRTKIHIASLSAVSAFSLVSSAYMRIEQTFLKCSDISLGQRLIKQIQEPILGAHLSLLAKY